MAPSLFNNFKIMAKIDACPRELSDEDPLLTQAKASDISEVKDALALLEGERNQGVISIIKRRIARVLNQYRIGSSSRYRGFLDGMDY